MKASLVLLILSLVLASCASPTRPAEASSVIGPHPMTEAEAIALVMNDIERGGGDSRGEVFSAMRIDGGWHVLVQHNYNPDKKAKPRFVFGGQSFYTISSDGHILTSARGK